MLFVILGVHASFACAALAYQLSSFCYPAAIVASFLWHAAWVRGTRSARLFTAAAHE